MSQYPQQQPSYYQPQVPPGAPLPYVTAGMSASPRPTSVTVLSIIGIVLGSLGFLNGAGGVVLFLAAPQFAGPGGEGGLLTWNVVSSAISAALAMLLLVMSIAALRLRAVGRSGMIIWAGLYIAWTIIAVGFAMVYVLPKTVANNPAAQSNPAMRGAAYFGAGIAAVIFLIFPTFVLVYMNRPNVKAAFAGTPTPGAGADWAQPYGQPYVTPPSANYRQPPQQQDQWPSP
jgi:hypothetical protein